jgi:MFS family permease
MMHGTRRPGHQRPGALTPRRVATALGLDRNILAISAAVFLLALGENLWKRFLPKYLEARGAPVTAIGLFGSCQDLLDGIYQYPGGWIADRHGRRRALVLFVSLATIGYVIYALAPSWPFIFAGLLFVMAWSSMASPTLFAVVGDALPRERRALGFTVQSILRRIPIAIAPTLGGLAIAVYGVPGRCRVHFAGFSRRTSSSAPAKASWTCSSCSTRSTSSESARRPTASSSASR